MGAQSMRATAVVASVCLSGRLYATLRHETQERMQWPAHLANE
jgi:succinate dehydrogenase hydrophobic anchor subunit